MKTLRILLCLALLSLPAFSQSYLAKVLNASDLQTYQGQPIQFSFSLWFGAWHPQAKSHSYNFTKNADLAQVLTVGGISQLYLQSNAPDVCDAGCSYWGTFSSWNGQPEVEGVSLPDGSIVQRVSGTLIGTFTINGRTFQGVAARFYFESYSATFVDQDWVNAPGGLIVELFPN